MQTILLVGSSIFEAWTSLAALAPAYTIRNRAVGGTTTAYWRAHLGDIVRAEAPDLVLFYCGSNDINDAVAEEEIIANTLWCCNLIHEILPTAAVAYFSIIKAPQKAGKWELITRLNAAIHRSLPESDLYVESNEVFFQAGQPVPDYFLEDGLHHPPAAYAALAAYVLPRIASWLDQRRTPDQC